MCADRKGLTYAKVMSHKQGVKEAIHDTATEPPRIAVSFSVDLCLMLTNSDMEVLGEIVQTGIVSRTSWKRDRHLHGLYFYAGYAQYFDGASQNRPVINANCGLLLRLLKSLNNTARVPSVLRICRASGKSNLCPERIELIQDMIYMAK